MKINILAKNMELTEAITKYVTEKVNSIEKYIAVSESEPMAEVEVGKTTNHHQAGDVYRTEINLTIGGTFVRVEATMDDLYASIDTAKDAAVREVTKSKDKQESIFRKGAAKIKKMLRGEE
jgi:putative sigma-54 modulation protein